MSCSDLCSREEDRSSAFKPTMVDEKNYLELLQLRDQNASFQEALRTGTHLVWYNTQVSYTTVGTTSTNDGNDNSYRGAMDLLCARTVGLLDTIDWEASWDRVRSRILYLQYLPGNGNLL
jgi:hypothetical protein